MNKYMFASWVIKKLKKLFYHSEDVAVSIDFNMYANDLIS